jgi:hypothetical protein
MIHLDYALSKKISKLIFTREMKLRTDRYLIIIKTCINKMIDQKLAIITVHDINPSHSEEILTVTEQLNKLKVKYNLSIVPYYSKK